MDDAAPRSRPIPITPEPLLFRPDCPSRPLDWRWRRAGLLLDPRARRLRRDDSWVARARRFRKALDRVGGDVSDLHVARLDQPVLGASLLAIGDRARRWELEARLLARQADAEIADQFGVDPEVVAAYEALFYCVRDRIDCVDWVTFEAIGPRIYAGFDPSDVEVAWKALAYHLGPVVLDALLDPDLARTDPGLAEQLDLLVRLMATPVTSGNAMKYLKLYELNRRIERSEADRMVDPAFGSVVVAPDSLVFGPMTVPIETLPDATEAQRDALSIPIGHSTAG
jgi:hypothetical protein